MRNKPQQNHQPSPIEKKKTKIHATNTRKPTKIKPKSQKKKKMITEENHYTWVSCFVSWQHWNHWIQHLQRWT